MAAALLDEHLSRCHVQAEVRSAGILEPDIPARPEAVAAMAERGIDISAHRSRHLDASAVRAADLVLGMAREHAREVIVLDPDAYGHTFTLKELVRRGEADPRHRTEKLGKWCARLTAEREASDLLGSASTDDVDDPIGAPLSAFRATARELDGLVTRLVRVTWPSGTT